MSKMSIYLLFLSAIFASSSVAADNVNAGTNAQTARVSPAKLVPDNFNAVFELRNDVVAPGDGKVLTLPESNDGKFKNGCILLLKKDKLKPNTRYSIKMSLEAPRTPDKPWWACTVSASYTDNLKNNHIGLGRAWPIIVPNPFCISFKTPSDLKDFDVKFWRDNITSGKIVDFRLIEGDDFDFYPITADTVSTAPVIQNLPTGAKDFEVLQPSPQKEIVVNAADFGLNEGVTNASTIINKAIEHCKKIGASKLVLPKGKYKSFEKSGILIDSMKDFTFDGGGSTIVFNRGADVQGFGNTYRYSNVIIRNCERVKFERFKMDWDFENDPLSAVVEVVANGYDEDAKSKYVDVKFLGYDSYPLVGKPVKVFTLSSYNKERMAYGTENCVAIGFGLLPWQNDSKTKWVLDNVLRIYKNFELEPHSQWILQHHYYGIDGFNLISNKHLTLRDIKLYACKGHAFAIGGTQSDWQMINVDIVSPNLKIRPQTCTADHLHFYEFGGNFKMIDCEISGGADDGINVHNRTAFAAKTGEKNLKVLNSGSGLVYAGGSYELREFDYSPTGKTALCTSVKWGSDGKVEAVFADALPEPKGIGFVLLDRKVEAKNIIVKNSYFHRMRARGVLILCDNATVENCRFENIQMGAIKLETGYTLDIWSEGYGVDNVVVKNCSFDSSNLKGVAQDNYEREIFIGAYLCRDPSYLQSKYPVIKNVLFENNKFKDTYGVVAFIASAGNIIFRNNTFENPTSRIFNQPYRASFYVKSASGIKILDNTFIESPNAPNPGVYVDDETARNAVTLFGNKLVKQK